MGDEGDRKTIKVVDRRRFTSDGEAREDIPETSTPASRADAAPEASSAEGRPRRPIDFVTFVASLGTNALAAMGALEGEALAEVPRDMNLAREYIAILEMLREKTRGNLDPEEKNALDRLIGDLKMTFVQLSSGGSSSG